MADRAPASCKMDAVPTKDKLVVALIDSLRSRLGSDAFRVVDHWPDDPMAVGFASPQDPGVLAYVSITPGADEPYFVSLELPPDDEWADHPYMPGDERNECALDELVAMIAGHMRKVRPDKSVERARES